MATPSVLSFWLVLLFFLAGGETALVRYWFRRRRWPLLFLGYSSRIVLFLLFPLFGGSHLSGGDVVCACVGGVRLCGCSI
jgi:hypothetical protein